MVMWGGMYLLRVRTSALAGAPHFSTTLSPQRRIVHNGERDASYLSISNIDEEEPEHSCYKKSKKGLQTIFWIFWRNNLHKALQEVCSAYPVLVRKKRKRMVEEQRSHREHPGGDGAVRSLPLFC